MLNKKNFKKINNKNIYNFLINIGKKLPKLPKKIKKKKFLLKRCLTKVWLFIFYKKNKIYIIGKSESNIINGLIYLIIKYYSNKSINYILSNKNDLLRKINFHKILTLTRYIGFIRILRKIKKYSFKKKTDNYKKK